MTSVIFVILFAYSMKLTTGYILTEGLGNEDPDLNKWPSACEGKNYCWEKNDAYIKQQKTFDALLSGQSLNYRLGDEIGDRDGSEVNDIGHCKPTPQGLRTIYMIKDEDGTVWYVPQSANYAIRIQIEECKYLGRITEANNTGMNPVVLMRKEVHCVEQRVGFKFPVLKQSNNKNEIILRSPHGGLPLSCSTKIIRT